MKDVKHENGVRNIFGLNIIQNSTQNPTSSVFWYGAEPTCKARWFDYTRNSEFIYIEDYKHEYEAKFTFWPSLTQPIHQGIEPQV